MAYPRFQMARGFKFARRTSGNLTFSATAWANFDTGLDLVLAASVGDVIEATAGFVTNAGSTDSYLDVATIVSAAVVNTFSMLGPENAGSNGIAAWWSPGSLTTPCGGPVHYTIASGDIAAGQVTLRLRVRCTSATAKIYYAADGITAPYFHWAAKNLGPVDPN